MVQMLNTIALLALLAFNPGDMHPWRHPHIVTQRSTLVIPQYASPEWEARIFIRNPLKRAVWLWLDCRPHFTSNAIGMPAHHMSEFTFPDIAPGEHCKIDHWEYQRPGHSPEHWEPK